MSGPNEVDCEPGAHDPTAALRQKCDNDEIDLEPGVPYEDVTPDDVEDFELREEELTFEGVKNEIDDETPLSCVTFGRYREKPDAQEQ